MTVARKLREKDTGIKIIFVTNMAQYAIHGYEVDAVDFIVKPISYYVFVDKLKKALRYLNLNKEDKLYVIDGQPPDLKESIDYCPFVKRCTKAMKICMQLMPEKTQLNKDHYVKCWLEHEFAPKENREEF